MEKDGEIRLGIDGALDASETKDGEVKWTLEEVCEGVVFTNVTPQ